MRQKVVVTGASGFIGSAVVHAFLAAGHDVAIICRPTSNLARLKSVMQIITIFQGDLGAQLSFRYKLEDWRPEVFVHCAWEGVLGKLRNDDIQMANVANTVQSIRTAKECGCKAWIGLGSQAEYGPANETITETFPLNPTTLYGKAKVQAYQQGRDEAFRLNIRFAWLRVFSTYGPGDSPEWMIPSLIEKLLDGDKPALTAGEQLWDYLYVSDAARAVVAAAESPQAHGAYNLGSGTAVPLRQVIEQIRNQINPSLPLGFGEVPYREDQVMKLHADMTRFKGDTGWVPKTALDKGIETTIAYHRKQRSLA